MPTYQIFATDSQGRIDDEAEPVFEARSAKDATALLMVAEMYVTPYADIVAFNRRVSHIYDHTLVRVEGQQFCPSCRDYVETRRWPFDTVVNPSGSFACVHCGTRTIKPAPKLTLATVTEGQDCVTITMLNGDEYTVE